MAIGKCAVLIVTMFTEVLVTEKNKFSLFGPLARI